MPELPEVEVVKRSLEKKILNLVIKKVEINDGNLRYKVKKRDFSKLIETKIKKIKRRSKFLISTYLCSKVLQELTQQEKEGLNTSLSFG